MTLLLTVENLKDIIQTVGFASFFEQLTEQIISDFKHWDDFQKSPRHACHYPHGVIELMPVTDDTHYAFKYVNGHPSNPDQGMLTVMATGMLSDAKTGYPLLMSEMTLLTAFRTAATAALAAQYLARPQPQTVALIGTGAQSEFEVLAHHYLLGCKRFHYFDTDPEATKKFADNMAQYDLTLTPFSSTLETVQGCDIVITATADKKLATILTDDMIAPGTHINGLGGDCPGKTELAKDLLERCKIVVEYLPQTQIEGEIQQLDNPQVYAELWELIQGSKPGRESASEITLFDSVGFALEDYSALKLAYTLAQKHGIGTSLNMIPNMQDPKNIFSELLNTVTRP